MTCCWIDWYNDENDEGDLLKEFEKMLNGEPNEYKAVKKEPPIDPDYCPYHDWELIGRSPVLDLPWYNCKKCGITKEKHDKKTKPLQRPLL